MSRRRVGAYRPSASNQWPRWMCSRASRSALRFKATRWPAKAWSAAWFCACRPRMRTGLPCGPNSRVSPTATWPDSAVPVTTIPAPATLKARSIARRKPPSVLRCCTSRWACSNCWRRVSMPSPVTLDSAISGASAYAPGASKVRTCSRTICTRALSTRSHLLIATSARGMPSNWTIARCSRVCGITPSSAATTSNTRSMPCAPASMLWVKRSWPGTSMNPVSCASASSSAYR
ncbi:hypothetical protein D3C75_518530 [compost metagenome]